MNSSTPFKMDYDKYEFNEKMALDTIEFHWRNWSKDTGIMKFVLGISGGVDSTLCAALGCRIFGKENIIGVSMPCGEQSDMEDVDSVFSFLGIRRIDVNVGNEFNSILKSIEGNGIEATQDTRTNLPPRIRMSVLYAVSQSIPHSTVLCTANLSETVVGFATLYGDHAGSYSPIWDLTKTEVVKLSKFVGVPEKLADKTPIDGLQPLTDEEKLGLRYSEIDKYVRTGKISVENFETIGEKFRKNRFKFQIVQIPHPSFGLPNHLGYV